MTTGIGYCIFTFEGGDWTHDDFPGLRRGFEEAARLGFDYVEVPSLVLADRPRLDLEFLRRMGSVFQMSEDTGVPLSAVFASVDLLDESLAEHEEHELVVLSRLVSTADIRHLPVTVGIRRAGTGLESARELAVVLSRIGAKTMEYGVKLAVHPHIEGPLEHPDQIDAFYEKADPETVGMCFDAGHILAGGGDPLGTVERHRDRIDYVHLKDVSLQAFREASGPDLYTAFRDPGEGDVDFPALVASLRAGGFEGPILAENDLSPDPTASMERSLHYLREELGLTS